MSKLKAYWDTCVWIALFSQSGGWCEQASAIYALARKGEIKLLISTLVIAEISKHPKSSVFFKHGYISRAGLSSTIAVRAQQIQQQSAYAIKPADAVHIATAAHRNATELHTVDAKLLRWSNEFDKNNGEKLVICKPGEGVIKAPAPVNPSQ